MFEMINSVVIDFPSIACSKDIDQFIRVAVLGRTGGQMTWARKEFVFSERLTSFLLFTLCGKIKKSTLGAQTDRRGDALAGEELAWQ